MRRVLMSVALILAAAAGCKHHARKVGCNDCVGLGEPVAPAGSRIVPTEVPLAPRVAPQYQPYTAPQYQPQYAPDTRNYAPAPSRAPALPPREILTPDRPIGRPSAPPSVVPAKSGVNTVRVAPAPVQDGLPGYTPVAGLRQVAAGRKPTPAGFAALKRGGTKTVLYVHPPGADPSAAAELASAQGLTLVPLPVSAETLAADARAFYGILADPSNRPLYVVDDSGVRAGSLWYLYFRQRDYAGDEVARVRATPLGLPAEAETDEAKAFWIAVQRAVAGG